MSVTRRRGPTPTYTLPEASETAVADWLRWLSLGGMAGQSIRLRRRQCRMIAHRLGTDHPADVTLGDLVALCGEQRWSNELRKGVPDLAGVVFRLVCAQRHRGQKPGG